MHILCGKFVVQIDIQCEKLPKYYNRGTFNLLEIVKQILPDYTDDLMILLVLATFLVAVFGSLHDLGFGQGDRL